MFLPPQYVWFEPVLIASIVVFIIDLIGNSITFSNRYSEASSISATVACRCQRRRRQVPPRPRQSSLGLLFLRSGRHSTLGGEIELATTNQQPPLPASNIRDAHAFQSACTLFRFP
jgi:hypothetical protein